MLDTLPNNQRGKLQERKNISDYVHRKEMERLTAEERRNERRVQHLERLRETKNAKKRETRKRNREHVVNIIHVTNNISVNLINSNEPR